MPFDATAAKASDRGRLIVEAFPNSRLAKELRGAADKLEGRLEADESGAAKTNEVAAWG